MGNSGSKLKQNSTGLTESLTKNPLLIDKELMDKELIYEVQKENPNIEIITKLLKSGADPSYKDENGNTALKNINIYDYNKLRGLPPPPPFPIPIPPKKGGKKRNRKSKKNKRKGKSSKRRK